MTLSTEDIARFWANVKVTENPDDCWLWTACCNEHGYGRMSVGNKDRRAHRISFVVSGRTLLSSTLVLHSCDTPPCVNPRHLFAGTHKMNTRDMLSKGRGSVPPHSYGVEHHAAKFDVETHRRLREDKRPARVIAAELGVCTKTVYRHRRGETWLQEER